MNIYQFANEGFYKIGMCTYELCNQAKLVFTIIITQKNII